MTSIIIITIIPFTKPSLYHISVITTVPVTIINITIMIMITVMMEIPLKFFQLLLLSALQQQKEGDLPPKGAQLTKQMDVRMPSSSS